MSRIGKLPIKLSTGLTATFVDNVFQVKGLKGELKVKVDENTIVEISADAVLVKPKDLTQKNASAFWGLYSSLIKNAIIGVSEGFEKKLEINGVGYRATLSGNKLVLNLGYSNPIDFPLPAGISANVEGNVITISGIDKQQVGEIASQIRKLRKPEPYKGKGVKYIDEIIRRKAGKAAAKEK